MWQVNILASLREADHGALGAKLFFCSTTDACLITTNYSLVHA